MPPMEIPAFEVPLRASETLPFTPASLEHLPSPPVFLLRAITGDDQRWQNRLIRRHVKTHSDEQLRQIMRAEIMRVWGPETAAKFLPHLEEYWSALDEWRLQVKADPEIGDFTYDPEMLVAIDKLYAELRINSTMYADALSDNADAGELAPMLMLAVTVADAQGLEVDEPCREGGYFTKLGIEAVLKAFDKVAATAGVEAVTARGELLVACARRWAIPKDEVGNSASPSPSAAAPTSSEAGTESVDPGKSPASAKSPRKTSNA